MAVANMLSRAGHEVHIYEKNSQLGGRAGVLKKDNFTFDTGPSWYLMPDVFRHYFSLFDISVDKELKLKRLSPAYKVFFENDLPITITGDMTNDKASFENIEQGAGSALQKYVEKGDVIYKLALRHFLYTNFTDVRQFFHPEILRRSISISTALLRPLHNYVKSFVSDARLQKILEYPMVFLGTSPFKAPAMYSLMSALDFKEGVFYPDGGIYSIIRLLETIGNKSGVTYHLGESVVSILSSENTATGILLENGHTVDADIVISNADLNFTETSLLSKDDRTYDTNYWKKKQAGISALLVYVGVRGSLPELEHHNLFFVDEWEENFKDIYQNRLIPESASYYVSRPSHTDLSVAPSDHENLFMLIPLPTGISISKEDQDLLGWKFIDQLGRSINKPTLREDIVTFTTFGPDDFKNTFNAWEGTALGMSHVLTQSAFWRPGTVSKRLKNLYYVGGNTAPGVGLPMCLISAELVYKRIIGDKSSGPITHIDRISR